LCAGIVLSFSKEIKRINHSTSAEAGAQTDPVKTKNAKVWVGAKEDVKLGALSTEDIEKTQD